MTDVATSFLEATIRTATPLAFAAIGETVVERTGIINIGLEGSIIAGALAGVVVAGHQGVWMGVAGAALAGACVSALVALFVVGIRANQIIVGTAISMLALGATGTLYRIIYGSAGVALSTPTLSPTRVPILANIPIVGPALFNQPSLTYGAYVLMPLVWLWLYHTHNGLALRAIGEQPEAAAAAGIPSRRMRCGALLVGGGLGGIAGAVLSLAQAGTFAEGMSAGRGFIAIAIVVLGRWRPMGVALAALLFGAASALQYLFQATGSSLPYQLFLTLPYLLTLIALATARGTASAPAALGR